ncbi:hypothetical protein NLK61_23840 [Pseudomonas fuscovaginae UPB0736]|uniref:hypothetical protein n=1 Tax=Pseudomonas asplenii TaxID=53407 RepID=UPI00028A0184|nr:hypothetical protein [Pseudomonas fuscovaginae]UUQ64229.1 hypothetical protein NLK61_23840 [Pseudomonas fuscovaginae UPB0736]
MSPKHVAEFAGTTEVWLLLEAAQKHIAELTQKSAQKPNDSQLIEWLDRRGDLIPELETSVIRFPHEDSHLQGYSHIREALREAFKLDHGEEKAATYTDDMVKTNLKPDEQHQGFFLSHLHEPVRFISTPQEMEEHHLGEWVTYGAFDHVWDKLTGQLADTSAISTQQKAQMENRWKSPWALIWTSRKSNGRS